MLQDGWTISESQTFGKLKVEAWPFEKELDAATPRRHQTGIGPLREGPPGRVLPQQAL